MINKEIQQQVGLLELFTSFFKLGIFTFGGGYAMIPLIEREVIERRGWIERKEFIDLLTVAQSIPGPIALNAGAFIGYKSRGYLGAFSAVLGIAVPSFVIIMIVAIFFNSIRHNPIVDAAFKAMRPVVVALIVAPTISLMKGMSPVMIGVTILSMVLISMHLSSPATLILAAIVLAIIWTFRANKEAKGAKQ
ncbi:MAG: chromate transporter [Rikenellaceae bacterium]